MMVEIPHRLQALAGGFKAFLSPPPADVVRLTVGEPGFDTPGPITDAAIAALKGGDTHYTRGEGRESLCAAWAKLLRERDGIPVDGDGIVITPGAKQALLYSFMIAIDERTEVILLAPAWPTYAEQIDMMGGKPVFVNCPAPHFHPDIDAVNAAVSERTCAIVICSPSNPTGAVYTRAEMEALTALAIEHDLWIISDEIYAPLIWNGGEHVAPAALPGGFERTMTITGPSKSHAMTGWRVGVLACPPEVASVVGRIQGNTCSHIASFVMPAAEVAASHWDALPAFREAYQARRERLHSAIKAMPMIEPSSPEGAFYLMVDVRPTGMDAVTFANRALTEAKVQVIPLDALPGGEGHIRLSYAADDVVIDEGIARLSAWLDSL